MREFEATVATKGFIFGLLVTPLILGFMVVAIPRLMTQAPPKVAGEVAVIDPTGQVASGLAGYLRPEALAERREERRRKVQAAGDELTGAVGGASPRQQEAMRRQIDAALGSVPRLDVVALDPAADVEREKAPLLSTPPDKASHQGRLALVVVHANAVAGDAGAAPLGSFDLYVREKLDDKLEDEIHDGLREAIVDARLRGSA